MLHFVFKKFCSINPPKETEYADEENIEQYLNDVYDVIANGGNSRREYNFSTNVYPDNRTLAEVLTELVTSQGRSTVCEYLSGMLKQSEDAIRPKVHPMHTEIQKGLLVFFLVDDNGSQKLVIAKMDSTAIIEDKTGDRREGVDENRKVFKAFVADVKCDHGKPTFSHLFVIDSLSTQSAYWWRGFLLLDEIRNDTENTKKALKAIESKVVNPIKSKSVQDYFQLRGLVYAYFKENNEFDINELADDRIGAFTAASEEVNVEDLKQKTKQLPSTVGFDSRFKKDTKEVDKRYKTVVKVTDEIDIVLKAPYSLLSKDLKTITENGIKYLRIRLGNDVTFFDNK